MVQDLEIKNFKSLKDLNLTCRRMNVFIGKPNSGKSNILESLALFSYSYETESGENLTDFIKSIIRFETPADLFNDYDLKDEIAIKTDVSSANIVYENGIVRAGIEYGGFGTKTGFDLDFGGHANRYGSRSDIKNPFKMYRFSVLSTFDNQMSDFLLPVKGKNLLSIILTNKDIRRLVTDIVGEFGFRVVLKPQERKIEIQKEIDEVIISHPYALTSDTIQRIIFHLVAIETNSDSIIVFEEPETHSFPFYTKILAERIALNKKNQFFISTHNPYFLLSLLEKSNKDDIAVFITALENYKTVAHVLSENDIQEILDSDIDPFLNIERFL